MGVSNPPQARKDRMLMAHIKGQARVHGNFWSSPAQVLVKIVTDEWIHIPHLIMVFSHGKI